MTTARSSLRSWLFVAGMLALTIAAIAGWQRWFDAYGSADGLDAALVYPADGGARVIVLDRVSHNNRFETDYTLRLNLWAPGEDAPRIRERVPGARMLAADAAQFWLYTPEHGVHARDPATLEVRVDEAQLRSRNPALSAGLMPPHPSDASQVHSGRDEATGRFVVTTKDARRFVIDPETFAATPFTGERIDQFLGVSSGCVAAKPGPGSPRVDVRGDGPRQEVRIDGRSAGEFVTPQRLETCDIEAAPTSIALLAHRAVLEESAASQLTALSPADGVLWTADLTGDSGWEWVLILSATVSRDEVLLVVQGARTGTFGSAGYGLVTLDRRDGRITSAPKI